MKLLSALTVSDCICSSLTLSVVCKMPAKVCKSGAIEVIVPAKTCCASATLQSWPKISPKRFLSIKNTFRSVSDLNLSISTRLSLNNCMEFFNAS